MFASAPTLSGARLRLTPFTAEAITERYLGWLNDPEVNGWSRRRNMSAQTEATARAYLGALGPNENILAMQAATLGHIGNIKYGPVDSENQRCDIAILIGERDAWGMGYGAEAVYLVARHLFDDLGLNRIDAGSANPAFLRLTAKLGWKVEGVLRDRVRLDGKFHDWVIVAQLCREFHRLTQYETAA